MAAPETNASTRILVIDDDLALTDLLHAVFIEDGYTVLVANSGKDGLALAREHHPHLVLMDISMPDMNGYETAYHLKREPALKDTPVIFISGNSVQEDGGRSFAVGGLSYLRKPFGLRQIRDLAKLALEASTGPERHKG